MRTAPRSSSIRPTAPPIRACADLSTGKARAGKGKCLLAWEDVETWSDGLLAVLLGDDADEALAARLGRLKRTFGDRPTWP